MQTNEYGALPLKEYIPFMKKHKNVGNAVLFSAISCVLLIFQLILMKRNPINIVFDVVIPITAAFTFSCYAITMAMDRPVILICPPTVYFVSLLINQLISVEVGVEDTYPVFTFLELIPYLFFCVSVSTDKLKKVTDKIIKGGCVLTAATGVAVTILSVFFEITLYKRSADYISRTFGFVCSLFAVMFIYLAMIQLLKISGRDKRIRPKRLRKRQTKNRTKKQSKFPK